MSSVGDTAQDTPLGNAAEAPEATGPQAAHAADPQAVAAAEPASQRAEAPAAQPAGPQDNYLEALQRLKAEFDNYRRRVREQQSESAEKATAALVEKLLPVVDACEAALSLSVFGSDNAMAAPNLAGGHGANPAAAEANPASAPDTGARQTAYLEHEHQGLVKLAELLLATLQEHGLTALLPEGQAFDPNCHEAIEHSPAADGELGAAGPVVKEVVRTGYIWRDQLLRPAMVKVKG